MGGSSKSSSSGSSRVTYTPTTTNTPYATIYTDNNGTNTVLKDGAMKDVYDFTNANMAGMLEEWKNPTLDTATNQAKIKAYNKVMNKNALTNLENNIIQPLSQRNMIRSSQATDLYKGLNNSLVDKYDDFVTQLLANSQTETGNMINQLQNWYLQGQNTLNNAMSANINQAGGHAITNTNSNGSAA